MHDLPWKSLDKIQPHDGEVGCWSYDRNKPTEYEQVFTAKETALLMEKYAELSLLYDDDARNYGSRFSEQWHPEYVQLKRKLEAWKMQTY